MWVKVARAGLAGLVVLASASCTESDPSLFQEIGVTQLLLVDPALSAPAVEDPTAHLQVMQWQVTRADLLIGTTLDLTNGEACKFTDTVLAIPVAASGDACGAGLVIESSPAPVQVRLVLELSMLQVRRAPPVDLRPGGDFDGDGVPNDGNGSGGAFDAPCGKDGVRFGCDDNCPFVANPDQADPDGNGIGTVCTSSAARDSDADGFPDILDNCVWVPNADQSNTGADGITDFIGDACPEQIADVLVGGSSAIHLDLGPIDLTQLSSRSFLTVDFNSARALQCDWDNATCELDPAQVRFCAQTDLISAIQGCPAP